MFDTNVHTEHLNRYTFIPESSAQNIKPVSSSSQRVGQVFRCHQMRRFNLAVSNNGAGWYKSFTHKRSVQRHPPHCEVFFPQLLKIWSCKQNAEPTDDCICWIQNGSAASTTRSLFRRSTWSLFSCQIAEWSTPGIERSFSSVFWMTRVRTVTRKLIVTQSLTEREYKINGRRWGGFRPRMEK